LRCDHLPCVGALLVDEGHANQPGLSGFYGTHQHRRITKDAHTRICRCGTRKCARTCTTWNDVSFAKQHAIGTAAHEVVRHKAAEPRGIAFAEHADLLWWETSHPNLADAKRFAEAVQKAHPGKMMAYNCSPSFNWEAKLDKGTIAKFQRELGAMGYKFQFVTLAGFHQLNHGMFELARGYRDRGMPAYSELQQAEFASEAAGYTATRHQREVGTGYFDLVAQAVSADASTTALAGSTEADQFRKAAPVSVAAE